MKYLFRPFYFIVALLSLVVHFLPLSYQFLTSMASALLPKTIFFFVGTFGVLGFVVASTFLIFYFTSLVTAFLVLFHLWKVPLEDLMRKRLDYLYFFINLSFVIFIGYRIIDNGFSIEALPMGLFYM